MSRTVNNVNEYYETLTERFVAAKSDGIDAVFQWEIEGDGGRQFHAVVKGGAVEVAEGAHEKPNVTLKVNAENYLKIVNGQMKGLMAVMTRKMKVDGNIKLAKKMNDIFPIEF